MYVVTEVYTDDFFLVQAVVAFRILRVETGGFGIIWAASDAEQRQSRGREADDSRVPALGPSNRDHRTATGTNQAGSSDTALDSNA